MVWIGGTEGRDYDGFGMHQNPIPFSSPSPNIQTPSPSWPGLMRATPLPSSDLHHWRLSNHRNSCYNLLYFPASNAYTVCARKPLLVWGLVKCNKICTSSYVKERQKAKKERKGQVKQNEEGRKKEKELEKEKEVPPLKKSGE